MSDIFLSYAREDRDRARDMALALERIGWSVWWDRKTPPGMSFSDVIQQQLEAARCVIVLWSVSSVRSEWVEIEASHARQRGILVPVLIDDVAEDVPLEFSRTQAARLVDWRAEELHEDFESLAAAVGRLIPLEDRTVVSGIVRDAVTGDPVGDARVSIRVGDREFITTSDPSGRFQWREDRSFVGDAVVLDVAKTGFDPWRETQVVQESDLRVEVALAPVVTERSFVTHFSVVDGDGRPLSGADVVVTVNGDSFRPSPTDASGQTSIEVDLGLKGHTARYTAMLPGHDREEGDVRLDSAATVVIRMSPEAGEEDPLPEWLRGVLRLPGESFGRWQGALLIGFGGALFVSVAQLINYGNDSRDLSLTVAVGLSIMIAGPLYAVAGAIGRMRKAPLFFGATLAVGVMGLWVFFFGTAEDVVGAALVAGGSISAIVGTAVGRARAPVRLGGMILLGLWPFLFVAHEPFGADGAFLANPVIIGGVVCLLAWFKPIPPRSALKFGALPFALNLAGGFVTYAMAPQRLLVGSGVIATLITVLAATSLGAAYWISGRRTGARG
jgi:hypothetical protein